MKRVEPDGLQDKLRRAFRVRTTADAAASSPAPSPAPELRELLQRRLARMRAHPRERVPLPEGVEEQNARGTFFVRRLRYPIEHAHGCHSLGHAARADWNRLAELAKQEAFAGTSLAQCLFLDTETTGLFGGAGNLVFLCGMAFFENGPPPELILEQVFLRAFAEEAAALHNIAERLAARPTLVTFVGKTFDRHRLAARMAVNRVASPVLTANHLDLYYLARRRWREELPDVKLRTVERHVLRLRRDGDLPGAEAPAAFLSWLRDGTGPVDRVLEHNRLDVLSLVVLLGVLGTEAPPANG